MTECERVAAVLTALVDGEAAAADGARAEAHVAACARCASALQAERTARAVLRARREVLAGPPAPAALRARLAVTAKAPAATASAWARWPVAVAATLVLAVGGLHLATGRSTTVLAAQLAADHAKCHWIEGDRGSLDPAAVQNRLATRYGFDAQVPAGSADARLRLVGARRCITGEGRNAHILYRYDGHPVSLYLVPAEQRPPVDLDVMGTRTFVWSRHNGTYVLVADASMAGLPELASYMQHATE